MRLSRLVLVGLITAMMPPAAYAEPTPEAAAYLDRAVDLIRQHHKDSPSADWDQIASQARDDIATAITPDDTYPAIWQILRALGERHSFLVEPGKAGAGSQARTGQPPDEAQAPTPTWLTVQNRYAIMRLPALNTMGADGEALGVAYTTALRQGLEQMESAHLCGWIVDLRNNGGGNMWPMLQGLDPLLGDPPFGYFTSRGTVSSTWTRAHGRLVPMPTNLPPTPPSFTLDHGQAPLAVLIGPGTASSGEMTALALIGRGNVRTFGAPTAGLTTGNSVHPLSDGALLVITSVTVRDRTGKDYSGPIEPDVLAADDAESAAIDWLGTGCR
jgi:carboxyl-terminal processing protease